MGVSFSVHVGVRECQARRGGGIRRAAAESWHGFHPKVEAEPLVVLGDDAEARAGGLTPRCVVDYTRAAFCHPAGNVRITLDSDVRVSRNTDAFFDEPFAGTPALQNGACVLELKFDGVMPDFIPALLGMENRTRTAMSKYAAGGIYY